MMFAMKSILLVALLIVGTSYGNLIPSQATIDEAVLAIKDLIEDTPTLGAGFLRLSKFSFAFNGRGFKIYISFP